MATSDIHRIMRNNHKQLCTNKLEDTEKKGGFLGTHNLPKFDEAVNNLNITITRTEIESLIKSLPKHKSIALDGSTVEF